MKTMRVLAIVTALSVLLLMAVPMLARLGCTSELRRWTASNVMYGMDRALWLAVNRDVAYVDVFRLYPTYRMFITDGGYAYFRDIDIPTNKPNEYLAECAVGWEAEGVSFKTPDGEILFVPATAILAQVGK